MHKYGNSLFRMLLRFFLINILFSVTLVSQTNFYISKSGNDANNGTSPSTPWKTLDKLWGSWNLIGPGDSILFKRGDKWADTDPGPRIGFIRIPNDKSGLPGSPIVIGAYGSGSRPIISAENCSVYNQVLRTGSFKYITVQDLEFRGNLNFRAIDNIDVGIQHFRLLNIVLDGSYAPSGGKASFYNPYSPSQVPDSNHSAPIDYVEIGYCTFRNTTGEDAFNIGSCGDYLWVHHNEWYDVSEEALDVAGGYGHVIEYNLVSGTSANGMKFHSQYNPCFNITIRGNVYLKGKSSSGYSLALENIWDSRIYNNTIVAGGNGWALFLGDVDRNPPEMYYGTFKNNVIRNNLIVGATYVRGRWNHVVDSLWARNTFSNNSYWRSTNYDLVFRIDKDPEVNIYSNQLSKFATEWQSKTSSTEKLQDPLFINNYWTNSFSFGDFGLTENSPGVNSGYLISGYTEDINGNPVPQGGLPERGAYENAGEDLIPPELLSAEILSSTSVKLQFSEALNQNSITQAANFQINNGISVLSASTGTTSDQVMLTTSAHNPGNYSVVVNNVEDLSGNSIASSNTAQYLYDPDLIPPVVSLVEILDAVTLRVTFSEDIDPLMAQIPSNYQINNGINVNSAVLQDNSPSVILNTSVHSSGSYSITVSNIGDLSGNIIVPVANQYNYQGDITPPNLLAVRFINFSTVDLDFSEALDINNAEVTSNYSMNNNASIYSAELSGDAKTVRLLTSGLLFGTNYIVTVSNVTDLSGNVIGSNNSANFLTPDPANNLVKNGNFENGNLNDWDESNALGGAVYSFQVNNSSPLNGSYDAKLAVTSAGSNQTRPLLIAYLADSTQIGLAYELSFKTKVISGNPMIKSIYFDGVKTADIALNGSEEWTFVVESAQLSVDYIGFYTDGTRVGSFSIDDVVVKLILPEIELNAKVFLEGPYNGSGMNTNLNSSNMIPALQPFNSAPWNYSGNETISTLNSDIVDWLLVELRSSTAQSSMVMRKPVLLKNNGVIVDVDGVSKPTFQGVFEGDYYLVLLHRNHLPIMSKSPVTLTASSPLYDFTQSDKAFGLNPMKNLGGNVYGMISGDGNASYDVTASDYCLIWNNQNGSSGYLSGDFDLNGSVNNSDKFLHWIVNNGRVSQIPHN